jgi:hypothetical protein
MDKAGKANICFYLLFLLFFAIVKINMAEKDKTR